MVLLHGATTDAYSTQKSFISKSFMSRDTRRSSSLSMVLEKEKKLSKIEVLKINSDHLTQPLLQVSF